MLLSNEKTNLPPPKFLQIKQEDKTFASLLSKEHQRGESSFRVMYYGGTTGSIPFLWESQPGTPKHTLFSDSSYSLPPLTPPPSYQSCPKINVTKNSSPKSKLLNTILPKYAISSTKPNTTSKSALLNTIFSKLSISSRKSNIIPITSSNYSLSSSCSNSSSSYSFTSQKNSLPRSRSPIYFGLENDYNNDDDDHEVTRSSSRLGRLKNAQLLRPQKSSSRALTMCFGTRNNKGCRRSRGRRHVEVKSLRKGFMSIFASRATV